MSRRTIVFWLEPAKDERDLFKRIIRILAKQLDAPTFAPHLTLALAGVDQREAKALIKMIRQNPIVLAIGPVTFSGKFTKTLFVRFRPNKSLDRLVRSLQRISGASPKPLADPHLSLCYKKLPERVKRELAATIKLPFRKVTFDSLTAVQCAVPTRTGREVQQWKIIARRKLAA